MIDIYNEEEHKSYIYKLLKKYYGVASITAVNEILEYISDQLNIDGFGV